MIDNKKFEWVTVSLALLLSLALRTYNFFELSFFHDELSALTRTQFDSISALFSQGILVDGHPPLIQVFLYFWTSLFGYEESIVKLPFLIIAMVSLYMLYKMSKMISGSWLVGLGVLIFFATNQLHIAYSTIARMYITGFLFSISLVYFWWKWLQNHQKRDFVLMIVFAALGVYNHHFNLLFALLVWGSGWFYVTGENRKSYLKALLTVFILHLPSVYISLYQLYITKGLSWMIAPDLKFIFDFVQYLFHFRLLFAIIILVGIVQIFLSKKRVKAIVVLSLGWFVACFSIAYLYSIHVAPVLQYHLMLFALPFPILAALVGWERLLKDWKFIIFIALIASINIYTLVNERKHFEYFSKQPYKTLADEAAKFTDSKTLVVGDLNLKYLDFYLKRDHLTVDTLSIDRFNERSFSEVNNTYDYIITCGISEALESYFTPYFGSIQPSIQGFGYEIDVLEKQKTPYQSKTDVSRIDWDGEQEDWSFNKDNITSKNTYLKSENDQWAPDYESELKLPSTKQKLLCFEISYTGDTIIGEQFLVINFKDKNEKQVSSNTFPFTIEKSTVGKQVIRAMYDLDVLPKDAQTIKAFHWKKSKTQISIHHMEIFLLDKIKSVSFVTDSLEDIRDFNQKVQKDWSNQLYTKVHLENKIGEQYLELDNKEQWLSSYTFDYDFEKTYALEFEFKAKKLSPLSSVIIDVKNGEETIYWSENKLNTFFKSDSTSWTKAVIAVPYSELKKHEGLPLQISFSGYKAAGAGIKFKNPLIRSYKPNRALYGFIGKMIE